LSFLRVVYLTEKFEAGQLETVEMETGNGKWKRKPSKRDKNEC